MSTHQSDSLAVPPTKSLPQVLDELKQKLQGFAVFDQEGLEVGVVEDVILYENYPTLVVSFFLQPHQSLSQSLVWIRTNLVHKINATERSLVINTDLSIGALTASTATSTVSHIVIADSEQPYQDKAIDTSAASRTLAPPLPNPTQKQPDFSSANAVEEVDDQIRLLAERLVLHQSKHKMGEVVVRKVIETEVLEIPLLQEKLVIEDVPVEAAAPSIAADNPMSTPAESCQEQDWQSSKSSPRTDEAAPVELIRLLEERLVADTHRTKVSEVVVRKVVETQKVKVPIRWEKLVVEQVSPKFERLLEIDLHQRVTPDTPPEVTPEKATLVAAGNFNSLKAARALIDAIALEPNHGCTQVQIAITVDTPEQQQRYQQWFDRVTTTGKH